MRTIQSRNTSRWHDRDDRDRDEFSNAGMEDSWRNEDYYYYENDGDRRGYSNRDYSENNYWAGRDDVRGERFGQESGYVPAFDYGREGRHDSRRAVGYGNEGSRQMRDFERWREGGEDEGYFGRNSNDYRNGYGDRSYYDPRDYDRGGMRRNSYADNYNDYGGNDRSHRGAESYGDYQSYPSYEARGYRSGEYDPSRSNRFRNGGYGEREYGRPRRPNIREKRY